MSLLPYSSAPYPLKKQYNVFNVKGYGAIGDGTTDDSTAILAANTAAALVGGTVYFPPTTNFYLCNTEITPQSNVTYLGSGAAAIIKNNTANSNIFNWTNSSGTLTDVVFDSLCLEGPVNQTVTVPTRGRTTSGPGAESGIWIYGSLSPTGTFGIVTNVTVRNCIVRNTTWLPITIFGVTGVVNVYGNEFTNTMDCGFGFNQEVRCENNHSYMSADNGFSISRGNQKIVFVGNTVELCAYNGFFFSGYNSSVGPTEFTCTGNVAKQVGQSGIFLVDAPSYGTISGNTIDKGLYRGCVGGTSDTGCACILILGNNGDLSMGSVATGLMISGNLLRGGAVAGISIEGANAITIADNLIMDIGTEYLADGITVIAPTNDTQNIGILINQSQPVTNTHIYNNMIIDTRSTPYTNYGIQPIVTTGVTYFGNTMTDCRNVTNLYSTIPYDNVGIGTFQPAELLHISGNLSPAQRITNTGAAGAVTYIQEATNSASGATSVTISLGSATTVNDLLVLHLKFSVSLGIPGTITITDNAATPNTYAFAGSATTASSNVQIYQYFGVQVTGGATTVTISWTNSFTCRAIAEEYRGLATTNSTVIGGTASTAVGTGTNASVNAFTPQIPAGLVVAAAVFTTATSSNTAGSGYTLEYNSSSMATEYKLSSSTSETAPLSWTNSVVWAELAIAYNPLPANDWNTGYLNNNGDFIHQPTNDSNWSIENAASSLIFNINTSTGGIKIPTGASNGYVLTSDSSGNATWQSLSNNPLLLSTTSNINAKSTGQTNLYTVPTGKTCVITQAIVRCTAASSITNGPTASIGFTSTAYTDIYAAENMVTMTGTTSIFGYSTIGASANATATTIIKFNISTAASGTSQTIAVDLIGYLF